jgi:hypothetical protein
MEWVVEFDTAFALEGKKLARAAQLEIAALVGLLRHFGPPSAGLTATRWTGRSIRT